MKIGILTSSRSDYGIYLPLLKKLKSDPFFQLEIIAFGTHLSSIHGYTLTDIKKEGFKTIHRISSLEKDDSQYGISKSYGNTAVKFSEFWKNHNFNLVFCLGDRFEMSAAVQSSIPYGVPLAHIHGGETTLGAIDNVYRHQITLASKLHFTATDDYKRKVQRLTENMKYVYSVGALSLEGIKDYKPINREEFLKAFQIKNEPYALITFHPETVAIDLNKDYAQQMRMALEILSARINLVITMPNADTLGSLYRTQIHLLKDKCSDNVVLVENFGKGNYFSAMHYSKLLIGNTSSGIIEAASFGKHVVNVGSRQKGRAQSKNTFNVDFKATNITNMVDTVIKLPIFTGENIYFKEKTVDTIIETIKMYDKL
ncbi:UDP-N-acetylglucosamine 2-epimerase [Winogradskyella sp.]|uniref:UDP-N-acetylglucosamine 2-epimerase n=1 Tax=Winogradskyella sp. TaxID=1883156 RepID=UPI00260ED945|nr:UDP-N-acetylglucosamine 2-epimerase [Winogradskyella sp.]